MLQVSVSKKHKTKQATAATTVTTYEVGSNKDASCPAGTSPILDKAECITAASQMRFQYKKAKRHVSNQPKGCYRNGFGKVFMNTHDRGCSSGSCAGNGAPVCIKKEQALVRNEGKGKGRRKRKGGRKNSPFRKAWAHKLSLVENRIVAKHSEAPHNAQVSACEKAVPEGKRLVLVPIVPAYHSSTALEQALMSSPKLATLCSAGTWQCEGQWIRSDLNQKKQRLEPYSMVWDLDRPVFIDKFPGYGGEHLDSAYVQPWLTEPMPPAMVSRGIQDIELAYILMWRPVCLSQMSSHAVDKILKHGVYQFARHELSFLENTTSNYQQLVEKRMPVMVINLGDMLWNSEMSQSRLEEFLPCLGKLDFGFIPKQGKDVFPCNMWKTEGSIKSFSTIIDPKEKYGYQAESGHCDKQFDIFQVLSKAERKRAKAAVAELTKLSRLPPVQA